VDPGLLGFRRAMERSFLSVVRDLLGDVPDLEDQLEALVIEPVGAGTGVSRCLIEDGHRWQAREYLVLRSMYHLKEADPQAWAPSPGSMERHRPPSSRSSTTSTAPAAPTGSCP
jgi:hypothetical protein